MNITAKTKICMAIGDPIEHSLSPQMHNAGFEAAGIDYIFVASRIKVSELADFIKGIKVMGIKGISCTIPHKIEVMQYLDEVDDVAKKIGAVNTIVNTNGALKGYNTDWLGIVTPLEKITSLENKTVALLGAGGAARAAAYAVTSKGAKLTIYNRTLETAKELVDEFGGEAFPLEKLGEVKQADIIINTTSVGMHPTENQTPLPKEFITDKHIVLDAVYVPYETRFLKEAKEQGATIIHGTEMLLHQGLAQFKLYTGIDAPEEAMRNVLLKNVK